MSTEEDLQHVSFKDVNWLQMNPLNVHTALNYFSSSQFYDRSCDHEILKMQFRHTNHAITNEEMDSALKKMTGIQYKVIHNRENVLFVIQKIKRESETAESSLGAYYILDGTIYQAPTLYSILECRLLSCTSYLNSAFQMVSEKVKFDPTIGCTWDFQDQEEKENQESTGMVDKETFIYRKNLDTLIEDLNRERQFFNPKMEPAPPPLLPGPPVAETPLQVSTQPTEPVGAPPTPSLAKPSVQPAAPVASVSTPVIPKVPGGAVTKKKRTKTTDKPLTPGAITPTIPQTPTQAAQPPKKKKKEQKAS